MEKAQTEEFCAALTALQQQRIDDLLNKELNSFQQEFLDKYGSVICDAYQHLRQYGINHFIHYDNYRCIVLRFFEKMDDDVKQPKLFIEYERFHYRYPWELKEHMENKYLNEKNNFFGFKRAFVIEEEYVFDDNKIMMDPYGNSMLPLDQSTFTPGFTSMKLSETMGIRITTIEHGEKKVSELEGRVLEMHDRISGRC